MRTARFPAPFEPRCFWRHPCLVELLAQKNIIRNRRLHITFIDNVEECCHNEINNFCYLSVINVYMLFYEKFSLKGMHAKFN